MARNPLQRLRFRFAFPGCSNNEGGSHEPPFLVLPRAEQSSVYFPFCISDQILSAFMMFPGMSLLHFSYADWLQFR